MTEGKRLTGKAGLAHIKGRVLDATYVLDGEYLTPVIGRPPKPGSRIAKTYEALRDGPQTGYHLFFHGNHMPTREGKPPMTPTQFRAHLKWMVGESRLHVVRQSGWRIEVG